MHTPTTTIRAGHSSRAAVGSHAESAVQRVADASIWLLFRINRVKS